MEGVEDAIMRRIGALVTLFLVATACAESLNLGGAPDASPDAGLDVVEPDVSFELDASDACASTCTGDFKSTLDCHNTKVDCPSGQACANGACMAACAAAAVNKSSVGCEY
jgi:hypothetical protein